MLRTLPQEPKFSDVKAIVLYHYYLIALRDIANGRTSSAAMLKVVESIGLHVSTRLIEKAEFQLSELGMLSSEYFDYSLGGNREITGKGLDHVETQLSRPTSFFMDLEEHTSWFEENLLRELENNSADNLNTHPTQEAPASDRTVSLDHNSAEYANAIVKLGDVIEAVANDRTNDFEDKGLRLAELRAGRELLKSASVSPTKIEAVLYGCLGYLATKFADEPIGALAHLAWTAIKALLGH